MGTEDMFPCWLYHTVVEKDGQVEFSKHVWLPFVPQKGMSLSLTEGDADFFDIDEVKYSVNDEVFWLSSRTGGTSGFCSCTPKDRCCVMESSVRYWQETHGWEIENEFLLEKHPSLRVKGQFTSKQLRQLRKIQQDERDKEHVVLDGEGKFLITTKNKASS